MYYKKRPLPAGFMLVSMLGLVATIIYTNSGKLDNTWGFTFGLVFAMMFFASMLSLESNKVTSNKRSYGVIEDKPVLKKATRKRPKRVIKKAAVKNTTKAKVVAKKKVVKKSTAKPVKKVTKKTVKKVVTKKKVVKKKTVKKKVAKKKR